MSLSWYVNRFKTFSVPEIAYRVRQRAKTHISDKRNFNKLVQNEIKLPKSQIIESETEHFEYPIFEKSVDIFKPINWHEDVSTGKDFPKAFAHDIDIRSDEFGSAKHVWEVNRQLFLVQLALLYKKSGSPKYLDLIFYHLANWKNENPYLCGVNWYSNIEVNLRLIQWAFCWKLLEMDSLLEDKENVREFVKNIWQPLIEVHAKYSYEHPSLYSSANNHLIAEYTGLFVAAVTWKIPGAKKAERYARAGLEREILKQNSEDGINREEAAEYIQFINDFFLIAAIFARNAGRPLSEAYHARLYKMAEYLNQMLDMGGNYPMYGDGDDGFCLRATSEREFNNFTSQLATFATFFKAPILKRKSSVFDEKCEVLLGKDGKAIFDALPPAGDPISSRFYKESGHFFIRKVEPGKEIFFHFNAGNLGYLSIAAHGHADALSFTLNVDGKPFFVDVGTFTYHTHKVWRSYFVGTLAHNTVRIDECDQATLAGPTMWLNHYRTKILQTIFSPECISASHNGYAKCGVTHIREVRFDPHMKEFTIVDSLCGERKFTAEIPFHLHPSVTLKQEGGAFILGIPGARQVKLITDPRLTYSKVLGQEAPILGWYSEHFGQKTPSTTLYARTECNGTEQFMTRIKIFDE